MKKRFKILSSLLLPTALIATSMVAIPLSSCSKKNNESTDKISYTFNWSGTQSDDTLILNAATQEVALVSNITINGESVSEDGGWSFTWSSNSQDVQFTNTSNLTMDCINFNTSNEDVKASLILKATKADKTYTIINKTLIIKGQDTTPFKDNNYAFYYDICNSDNYSTGSIDSTNITSKTQFTKGLTINLTRDNFIDLDGSKWIYIDNGFKDLVGDANVTSENAKDYNLFIWSILAGQSFIDNATSLDDEPVVGFKMNSGFNLDTSVISFKYHLEFNPNDSFGIIPEALRYLFAADNNLDITVNYSPYYNK